MKIIVFLSSAALCIPVVSGCSGVTGESDDCATIAQRMSQILDERIEAAERIYLFAHYGTYNDESEPLWVCEGNDFHKPDREEMTVAGCGTEPYYCEADALTRLREDLVAGRESAASMIRFHGEAGTSNEYYFVHPDGHGEVFYELRTDIANSDCGSCCGWHRCIIESDMYLIDQHDAVHLVACDDLWSRILPENNLTCEEQRE